MRSATRSSSMPAAISRGRLPSLAGSLRLRWGSMRSSWRHGDSAEGSERNAAGAEAEATEAAPGDGQGAEGDGGAHDVAGEGEGVEGKEEGPGGDGGGDGPGAGWRLWSVKELRARVAEFFTFGEDEEGKARWVSLRTLDGTMNLPRQCLLVFMIAAFVLYPAWAQAALEIFSCFFLDQGEGPWPELQQATWPRGYWTRNMNAECYTGEHAAVWVPIGAACIVLVCAGVPLLSFAVTYAHRLQVESETVVQTYGFLFRRFRPRFYFWEAVLQGQTLLFVVVDVFGRVLPVYQKAVLFQLALILSVAVNATLDPTRSSRLKALEFLSFAALSATISLGLFFVPQLGQPNPMGEAARTAVGALILLVNLAVVLFFCCELVYESRDRIRPGLALAEQGLVKAGSRMREAVSLVGDRVATVGTALNEASRRLLTLTSSHLRIWTPGSTRSGSPRGGALSPLSPWGAALSPLTKSPAARGVLSPADTEFSPTPLGESPFAGAASQRGVREQEQPSQTREEREPGDAVCGAAERSDVSVRSIDVVVQ